LARETFPHFQNHAKQFYWFRWCLGWFFVFMLLLTVLMSWDIAHGRSVLQRLDQLTKDYSATLQANPELIKPEVCPTYEPDSAKLPDKPDGWTTKPTAVACKQLWYIQKFQDDAHSELAQIFRCSGTWCSPFFHVLRWAFVLCGGSDLRGVEQGTAAKGTSWQSATSVLMVFTTYILPMFYGFIGTVIGAFRSLQDKLRDSLLAPRDLGLTIMGMPLGAVAGIVVGLFFGTSIAPVQGAGGIAGDLSLTASGLAFLAGYGSPSFFKFIDNLLGKVFPSNGSPNVSAGGPPT
jgi:hypothetical protein